MLHLLIYHNWSIWWCWVCLKSVWFCVVRLTDLVCKFVISIYFFCQKFTISNTVANCEVLLGGILVPEYFTIYNYIFHISDITLIYQPTWSTLKCTKNHQNNTGDKIETTWLNRSDESGLSQKWPMQRTKTIMFFFVKIANSLAANCSLAVYWLEALKNCSMIITDSVCTYLICGGWHHTSPIRKKHLMRKFKCSHTSHPANVILLPDLTEGYTVGKDHDGLSSDCLLHFPYL